MSRKSDKRLRKLYEKFQAWKVDLERNRHRDLLSRIDSADKAYIDIEAGSKKFIQVTFFQKLTDRSTALWHSAIDLHNYCDPFKSYSTALNGEVKKLDGIANGRSKLRNIINNQTQPLDDDIEKIEKREDGTKISIADKIRSQIAFQKAMLEQRKGEKKISLTMLEGFATALEKETEDVQRDYKRWYRVLRRPDYFEILHVPAVPSSIDHGANSQQKSTAANETGDGENKESWSTKIKRFFVKNSTPLLIPIETAYAYAAFKMITPDDPELTIAAGIIFTALLVLTGAIFANFALRAFQHRIVGDNEPVEPVIETKLNKRMLIAASIFLLAGMSLIVGGADLRAKIPEIDVWQKERKELRNDYDTALQMLSLDNNMAKEIDYKYKKIIDHDKKRQEILAFNGKIDGSDEIIAIGIYLAMFLSAAASYIVSRDPYNEYSILSRYISVARSFKRDIDNSKNLIEQWIQNDHKSSETLILDLRSKLWLLDNNDLLSLSPYDHDANKDKPIDTNADDLDNANSPSSASNSKPDEKTEGTISEEESVKNGANNSLGGIWVADRLARYTRWYLLFFGRKATGQWGVSITKALQREVL